MSKSKEENLFPKFFFVFFPKKKTKLIKELLKKSRILTQKICHKKCLLVLMKILSGHN